MTRDQCIAGLCLSCLGLSLWVGYLANGNRELARRTHAVRAHSRDLAVRRDVLLHRVQLDHELLSDELRADLETETDDAEGEELQ